MLDPLPSRAPSLRRKTDIGSITSIAQQNARRLLAPDILELASILMFCQNDTWRGKRAIVKVFVLYKSLRYIPSERFRLGRLIWHSTNGRIRCPALIISLTALTAASLSSKRIDLLFRRRPITNTSFIAYRMAHRGQERGGWKVNRLFC